MQSVVANLGVHPLEVRLLCPFYIWINGLLSFFMLVASNGMVTIFNKLLAQENHGSADETAAEHQTETIDSSYAEKRVFNGLGSAIILIVILRLMDTSYYRKKLIPDCWFPWFESFYNSEENHAAPVIAPAPRWRSMTELSSRGSFTEVR